MKKVIDIAITLAIIVFVLFSVWLVIFYQQPGNETKSATQTDTHTLSKNELLVLSYPLSANKMAYLTDEYNKTVNGIDVSYDIYPREIYYDVLTANASAPNTYDLIMIDNPAVIGQIIPESSLVDISDLLDQDWRNKTQFGSQNGSRYLTSPLGIDRFVLYYNNTIFKDERISINDFSFENIKDACQKLIATQYCGIAVGGRSVTSISNMIVPLGYKLEPHVDYIDYATQRFYELSPFFTTNYSLFDIDDARDYFINGNAALYFGRESEIDIIKDYCDFDLGYAFIKIGDTRCGWFDYQGMIGINSSSNNKVEALNYLRNVSEIEKYSEYFSNKSSIIDSSTSVASAGFIPKENWLYHSGGKYYKQYIKRMVDLQQQNFNSQ